MDNSEQICAAATRLFARKGFDGTSIQAIADQVGIAKQTLLYHYPSKEALRQKVLDNLFEHWRKRLPQMLRAVTDGQRRFEALSDELLRFFQDDPDRARLLIREMLDNPRGMTRLLKESLRPWVLLVAEYIREGQTLGLVHPDLDPEAYVLNTVVSTVAIVGGCDVMGAVLAAGDVRPADRQKPFDELLRASRTALFEQGKGGKRARRAKEDS